VNAKGVNTRGVSSGRSGPVEGTAGLVATIPTATFEEFFSEEWLGAYRLASFLTQDPSAAEDLAQEAFARVYAAWGRAERPGAYLRTTVVNVCRNWRRHDRTRRAKLPLVAASSSVDFVAEELADAIGSLPFRQRAVLVLRYYEDFSEAEIADALGCRPGTVKSLASRALAQLEKVIGR
jgi:RNA polymerase sigma-70 factor (sigma-E family)